MKIFLYLTIFLYSFAIATPKEVTIAYNIDHPPLKFKNNKKEADGLIIDIWKLWSKKTGIKVTFKEAVFDKTIEMIKDGTADIHGGLFYTKHRDEFLDYSKNPFYKIDYHIFNHKSIPIINNINDVNGYIFGLPDNFTYEYVKKHYPQTFLRVYKDYPTLYKAAYNNEIKSFISPKITFDYFLLKNNLKDEFHYTPEKTFFSQNYLTAVKKDNNELLELVHSGFLKITQSEIIDIQRKWIKSPLNQEKNEEKETFIISCDRDYAPFTMINSQGKGSGLLITLWKLWAKKQDVNVKFIFSSWDESIQAVKNGIADFHSGMETDEKWAISSKAFYEIETKVYYPINGKTKNIKDFNGKTIAVIDSFYAAELKKKYPKINIVILKEYEDIFKELHNKKIDAFMDDELALENLLLKRGIKGEFDKVNDFSFKAKIYAISTQDNSKLIDKIDNGLDKISHKDFQDMEKRWLPNPKEGYYHKKDTENKTSLTIEEKEWIKTNPLIKIAIMNYWDSDDNGNSIHTDYLKLLNKYGNLNMIPVRFDAWKDGYNKVITGESIHGIMNLSWSKERADKYFLYTTAYNFKPNNLIVRESSSSINSLKDLENKTVYVKQNSITRTIVEETSSNIKIIELTDKNMILKKLSSTKEADATVIYKVSDDELKKYNLKIAKKIFNKYSDQHIGVGYNQMLLQSIINKVVKTIPKKELVNIQNKIYKKSIKKDESTKELIDIKLKLSDILPIKEIVIGMVVFLLLFYFIWKYQIRSSNKDIALKGILFIVIGSFLFIASLITVVTLENIEKAKKIEIKQSLKSILDGSYNTVNLWLKSNFEKMDIVVNNDKVITLLLSLEENNENLKELNNIVNSYVPVFKSSKYYFFSKDLNLLLTNNKSSEDGNIMKYIKVSNIDTNNKRLVIAPHKDENHQLLNMLFVRQIIDKNGNEIAYFVIEINSKKVFSKILQNGKLGNSGETYAFNTKLQMISNSRFDNQLIDLNILKKDQNSFLNLEIKTRDNKPTLLAQNVINKTDGVNMDGYLDYRDIKVYGAWKWDDKLKIGFATEIDKNEALGSFNIMKITILIIIFSIIAFTIFLMLLVAWINIQSKKSLQKANDELNHLLEAFDENIIASKTDLKGRITYASKEFSRISGYSQEELIGKPHNIVRHQDVPQEAFSDMWKTLKSGKVWSGEVLNKKKDGGFYWVDAVVSPEYDEDKNIIGYSDIRHDITAKKEVEELSGNLELKVEARTKDLERTKQEVEQILKNILLPVLITSKKDRKILYANKYSEQQYEKSLDEIIGSYIDDVYTVKGQHQRIIDAIKKKGFLENYEEVFKTSKGKEFSALLSVTPIYYHGEDCYIGMVTDISKQKNMENEIRSIHKHTKDSIEYASLIQSAVLPDNKLLSQYFKDQFVLWTPKDIVGGDIYLFSELRHKDECLLFFIDCTGHGVAGAFVTMLVKAVEQQILSNILADRYEDIEVSPAWIMGYFNKALKKLLKQDTKDSVSNAGWDGGIIYYNRRDQILKFAGAETPLFYIDENNEFKTIKGNRYSVGYKKCDANYQYKETIIEVKEGMKFYCTTDGYIDQNGGEKDFPFGKKRFGNIIKEHHTKSMTEQYNIFVDSMEQYEQMIPNNDRNDDMTIISFEIGKQSEFKEPIYEEIIKYEGVITQNFISTCIENIEYKIPDMSTIGNVSTTVIEMCQNMMNYSKSEDKDCRDIKAAGSIEVKRDDKDIYYVEGINIVSVDDKEKIEPKLIEIQGLDKVGIRKRYRELRKSGQNTHKKGGGIGMYEIAKISGNINYNFERINEDKYYFTLESQIEPKRDK